MDFKLNRKPKGSSSSSKSTLKTTIWIQLSQFSKGNRIQLSSYFQLLSSSSSSLEVKSLILHRYYQGSKLICLCSRMPRDWLSKLIIKLSWWDRTNRLRCKAMDSCRDSRILEGVMHLAFLLGSKPLLRMLAELGQIRFRALDSRISNLW